MAFPFIPALVYLSTSFILGSLLPGVLPAWPKLLPVQAFGRVF